jgi:hypothetical protein
VNSSVSFIDMLSYLDGAPFVGSFEARYGSLGIYGKPRFLDVGRRIPARDRFAPDSPLEEHGFEPLVPQREGIGLFETTLIDLWPFTSAGSNLPPRGTWSLHPVCSSGESDQSRSGYTAVLKGGCPDAGLHPDQATRHILGHGVLLPVRESPPGSKSASMIGQHRPLSQSAENHLSRGHGCSKVQQSRPTSRAPKKLIAAPLPPIDPAPEHDDADPPLAPRRTPRPTLARWWQIG